MGRVGRAGRVGIVGRVGRVSVDGPERSRMDWGMA